MPSDNHTMHMPALGNILRNHLLSLGGTFALIHYSLFNIHHQRGAQSTSLHNHEELLNKNFIDMAFDKRKSCDIHVFNSYLCIDNIDQTKYTRVYHTWFNVSFAWVNCPGTFPAHFLVTLVPTPSPAWRLLIESVCWLNKPPAGNACDYNKVFRFNSV